MISLLRCNTKQGSHIVDTVKDLPTYEQAHEALEMAGYSDILPDSGDELTITLDVTADSEGVVTYAVVNVEIVDKENC